MAALRPIRALRPPPPALGGRAAADIEFIRDTIENAGRFTAIPGRGGIAMGLIGCAGAATASAQATHTAWLVAWLATAAGAVVVGTLTLLDKSRGTGTLELRGVKAKYARSLAPPLVAGALLSAALVQAAAWSALPGAWLLLYGTALMTAGAFSIRTVRVMGACFMALGAAAFASPAFLGDVWLMLGFGGLHMGFGYVIWRRNGG